MIIDFGPSGFHALHDLHVLVFFPLLGSLLGQLVEAKHLVQEDKEKSLEALIDSLVR